MAELEARRASEAAHLPEVYLFGAGHVGRALAAALAPLPLFRHGRRNAEGRTRKPAGRRRRHGCRRCRKRWCKDMPAGSAVVILTHDHALDFLIATRGAGRDRSRLCRHDRLGDQARHLRKLAIAARAASEGLARPADAADRRLRGQGQAPEVIAAMTAAEILTAFPPTAKRSSS